MRAIKIIIIKIDKMAPIFLETPFFSSISLNGTISHESKEATYTGTIMFLPMYNVNTNKLRPNNITTYLKYWGINKISACCSSGF
jgi:uncharacterized protein (DUF427 family)